MSLGPLLPNLPLPLAQIAYRALNAKSPAEAHALAFQLAEATLRLAATTRLAVWLAEGAAEGPTQRSLERLPLASTGDWLDMLRAADDELAARSNKALLPLSDTLGRLRAKQPWDAVPALAEAASAEGIISGDRVGDARTKGLFAFFRFVNEYRTKIMAHGGLRGDAFYERMIPLWHAALAEVLGCPVLFGEGISLGKTWLAARIDGGRWLKLSGKAGIVAEPPNRERAERVVGHGELGLVLTGAVLRLHPFAVYRRDALENEQVAFLHRVETMRVDPAGSVPPAAVGPLTYFDYSTGRVFAETDARAAVEDILTRALGREITPEELGAQGPAYRGAYGTPNPSRVDTPAAITHFGPRVGAVFEGVRIERLLWAGGTELVYLASQLSTRRKVVLKVLQRVDGMAEERFRRGLVAQARCDHPNVVRVLTAEFEHDPIHYAMEYVHGADLHRLGRILQRYRASGVALGVEHLMKALEQTVDAVARESSSEVAGAGSGSSSSAPPEARVRAQGVFYLRLASLFAGVAHGLAHLHERKVVHRDIKPSNLVLTSDGQRLVLIDFGIARPVDASKALTRTENDPIGTLEYMAPECLAGAVQKVDPRSDIYSLGLTLYTLATGKRLVDFANRADLLRAHMADVSNPRDAAPELPAPLAWILEKALERKPERRYATAVQFAEDLEAFEAGRPLPHTRPKGVIARAFDAARRRPGAMAGALVGLGAVAAIAGLSWSELRVTEAVCAKFVERFGVPECASVAGAGDAIRYHVASRGGRVVRVRRLDGGGAQVEETQGPWRGVAEWTYGYVGGWPVVDGHAADGRVVVSAKYSPRGKTTAGLEEVDVHYLSGGLPRVEPGTHVAGRRVLLDEHGDRKEERFLNENSGPTADETGAFGYRYSRDATGGKAVAEPLQHE